MANTTFVQGTLITPEWLNDVNAYVYGGGGGGGATVWGAITGNILNQTDLQTALATKANNGSVVSQVLAGSGISLSPSNGLGAVTITATGSVSGVSQIVAGTNVTISPTGGTGVVTINSTASGGGGGTVTSTSVVSANGFAGTVATPSTTPAITISTSVTGLLKGNGTAISAAVLSDFTAIGLAPIASPTFTGTPAAPTAAAGTATTQIATTAFVDANYSTKNIPQNSQSAAYTLVLADSGKHIYHPSADTTARTFTIPANASVAFPIGTAVTFVNDTGAGVVSIAITTDTLKLAGAGTTGTRTLAANGVATAIKITSTSWIISGTGLT